RDFFFQAEDGIRDFHVTGVQTCALPISMAADPGFTPRDKRAAREALGLPSDAPLVGYMGGWAANRGTDILLRAFRLVRASRSDRSEERRVGKSGMARGRPCGCDHDRNRL